MTAPHTVTRHPDRIELRDENGLLVATLGPSAIADAHELAAAPLLLAIARDALLTWEAESLAVPPGQWRSQERRVAAARAAITLAERGTP